MLASGLKEGIVDLVTFLISPWHHVDSHQCLSFKYNLHGNAAGMNVNIKTYEMTIMKSISWNGYYFYRKLIIKIMLYYCLKNVGNSAISKAKYD